MFEHEKRAGVKGEAKRRSYQEELALLSSVFERFRGHPVPELQHWVHEAKGRPALFVASGGALPVARFAADLHERQTGQIAKALTPLELTQVSPGPATGVLLLSAGARHPDVLAAARTAASRGYRPLGLVTLRPTSELPSSLAGLTVQPVVLPSPAGREGFLATTSVLAMVTAVSSAYSGPDYQLPVTLPILTHPVQLIINRNALVLTGPLHFSAAADLETRMSELGLSHVQVTDYRNFAHGRHAGFNRNLTDTTVVAFVAPAFRDLAEATLRELPNKADVLKIETAQEWPASAIELIVASMQVTGSTASARDIEPSRPGVPPFGRRLYHLTVAASNNSTILGPVERKLLACGASPSDVGLWNGYQAALERWCESLRKALFLGIVVDYDGTCCETSQRFELTPEPVRTSLTTLLNEGCVLGFASGRGGSLHRDLRQWIPKQHWHDVIVGLYNGAIILTLDSDIPDQTNCTGDLAEAAIRLENSPLGNDLKIERRASQVSVEAPSGPRMNGASLAGAITEIISRPPRLELKIVASAHSADIVPMETGKAAVLEAVRERVGGDVLAIGDQGHLGGNDFELLAATSLSLSVDRCSADPTRCWNLSSTGQSGPLLLTRYLNALRPHRGGFRFSSQLATSRAKGRSRVAATNPTRRKRSQ